MELRQASDQWAGMSVSKMHQKVRWCTTRNGKTTDRTWRNMVDQCPASMMSTLKMQQPVALQGCVTSVHHHLECSLVQRLPRSHNARAGDAGEHACVPGQTKCEPTEPPCWAWWDLGAGFLPCSQFQERWYCRENFSNGCSVFDREQTVLCIFA